MRGKGKVLVVVLLMIAGALIGSALWSMLDGILPSALSHSISLGTTGSPFIIDLHFIVFTIGLVLTVNIGGIIGIAIALIVALKL